MLDTGQAPLTDTSLLPSLPSCSFERAEDAAHALVEAAQKHWAVRYAGRNCDDITVAVIFLPADPAAPQRP